MAHFYLCNYYIRIELLLLLVILLGSKLVLKYLRNIPQTDKKI